MKNTETKLEELRTTFEADWPVDMRRGWAITFEETLDLSEQYKQARSLAEVRYDRDVADVQRQAGMAQNVHDEVFVPLSATAAAIVRDTTMATIRRLEAEYTGKYKIRAEGDFPALTNVSPALKPTDHFWTMLFCDPPKYAHNGWVWSPSGILSLNGIEVCAAGTKEVARTIIEEKARLEKAHCLALLDSQEFKQPENAVFDLEQVKLVEDDEECPGCSEAGGAEQAVHHSPPLCPKDPAEKSILEELESIVANHPVHAGETLSHATANACGRRGWAKRNDNGDWIPTEAGIQRLKERSQEAEKAMLSEITPEEMAATELPPQDWVAEPKSQPAAPRYFWEQVRADEFDGYFLHGLYSYAENEGEVWLYSSIALATAGNCCGTLIGEASSSEDAQALVEADIAKKAAHKKAMTEPYEDTLQIRDLEAEAKNPSTITDCRFGVITGATGAGKSRWRRPQDWVIEPKPPGAVELWSRTVDSDGLEWWTHGPYGFIQDYKNLFSASSPETLLKFIQSKQEGLDIRGVRILATNVLNLAQAQAIAAADVERLQRCDFTAAELAESQKDCDEAPSEPIDPKTVEKIASDVVAGIEPQLPIFGIDFGPGISEITAHCSGCSMTWKYPGPPSCKCGDGVSLVITATIEAPISSRNPGEIDPTMEKVLSDLAEELAKPRPLWCEDEATHIQVGTDHVNVYLASDINRFLTHLDKRCDSLDALATDACKELGKAYVARKAIEKKLMMQANDISRHFCTHAGILTDLCTRMEKLERKQEPTVGTGKLSHARRLMLLGLIEQSLYENAGENTTVRAVQIMKQLESHMTQTGGA